MHSGILLFYSVCHAREARRTLREQAALRVLTLWQAFLARPDAREDASYDSVLSIVETLRRVSAHGAGPAAPAPVPAPRGGAEGAPRAGAAAQSMPKAGRGGGRK